MIEYFTYGLIFMTIAIIITFISSFFETESIVQRISIKIGNIIQILFLAGLLLSYQTYVDTSKQTVLNQQSTLTEKEWVRIYEKIGEYYGKCPNFCNSLSYPWQSLSSSQQIRYDGSTQDDYGAVLSLSILIFQSFESVITYFLYNDSSESLNEWISSFIIWANSDLLYDMWNKNKFIYDSSTQKFADIIFATVRNSPNRPQNPKDVIQMSSQICNSNVVKEIFKEYNKIPPCE